MKLPFPLIVEPPSSFTISPVAPPGTSVGWRGVVAGWGLEEGVTLELRLRGPCLGGGEGAVGALLVGRRKSVWGGGFPVDQGHPVCGSRGLCGLCLGQGIGVGEWQSISVGITILSLDTTGITLPILLIITNPATVLSTSQIKTHFIFLTTL